MDDTTSDATTTAEPATPLPAPGWYPDPQDASRLRRWDGATWLHEFAYPDGSANPNEALGWVLPVGRSSWAIWAGYAGLFALIVFPAPLALLLGLVAARDLTKHPEKKGWGRTIFGLVTGVLGTAVLVYMLATG
jgi:hypothetical protein